MKTWDSFGYRICGHYLAALINWDPSGLGSGEAADLREFERVARETAREAGFTVGHWSCDSGEESDDWGRCDVSGLLAMRQTVRLMVFKESAP